MPMGSFRPQIAAAKAMKCGCPGTTNRCNQGIPVGVILPSEKSYDHLIANHGAARLGSVLLFFFGLTALCLYFVHPLKI